MLHNLQKVVSIPKFNAQHFFLQAPHVFLTVSALDPPVHLLDGHRLPFEKVATSYCACMQCEVTM